MESGMSLSYEGWTSFIVTFNAMLTLFVLCIPAVSGDVLESTFTEQTDLRHKTCLASTGLLWSLVVRSGQDCASKCAIDSQCVSVLYDEGQNLCSGSNLDTKQSFSSCSDSIDKTERYYERWTLVFRQQAGVGGGVGDAFISGTGTDSTAACLLKQYPCTYRSPIVDNWQNEDIGKVKYSIVKGEKQVAFVEFNGKGSIVTDWFSESRLVNSSWTDMIGNTFNFFSIEGSYSRTWFISRNYGNCDIDFSWTSILDGVYWECPWDSRALSPAIIYSNRATGSRPNIDGHDDADEMDIWIQHG